MGALVVAGYAPEISEIELTDGSVGYMLPTLGLEIGEMVWPEWTEFGECAEPYDITLDAGVNAGVSADVGVGREAAAPGWEDCIIPGGELLER